MTSAPSFTEQSSSDQPPTRPQLRRSRSDKMLGGVCGGLADYTGIDPLLWRVGFVATAILGPGILAYLVLWVLMPPASDVRDDELGPLDRLAGDLHQRLTGRGTPPRG